MSVFEPRSFEGIDKAVATFDGSDFQKLNRFEKNCKVNQVLYDLLIQNKERRFLFSEIVDYITRICEKGILERYSFSEFEVWLTQLSELDENAQIEARALVVGKNLPRDEYQSFFPIAMGKQYEGPHFVTAHVSPDIDTLVASFWGFMDAFAARVGTGVHIWNVPGGKPRGVEAKLLFLETFGANVFDAVAKPRSSLTVTSYELMTQKSLIKRGLNDLMLGIDHERNQYAVILVDDTGRYLGDWRHFDVEGVRQVIMSFNALVRWLERKLHNRLISLFARESLTRDDFSEIIKTTYSDKLDELHAAIEYTSKQVENLNLFLKQVFRVEKGIGSSVGEFVEQLEKGGFANFSEFKGELVALENSPLFDESGKFVENRPLLFSHFERIFQILSKTSRELRTNIERFNIALEIKTHVFGYSPQFLSHRTEVQEIKAKMGAYPSMTVTLAEKDGSRYPMGVIHAKDLKRAALGTVTLRDFSNLEETKVPDYLEVISVIDHHKTNMTTGTPPMVLISDAQSCNTLVARLALNTYSRFSPAGMDLKSIEKQIGEFKGDLGVKSMRLLSRLYKRKTALERTERSAYYVHSEREILEYLHYIHAILDDTDLLTKVSKRDVDVMRDLLNRMESVKAGRVLEVVDFDDIAADDAYVKAAARRLLENETLYTLYKRVYAAKEKVIDEDLLCCSKGKPSAIFDDVKIQNGCARVGQTKFFSKNYPLFSKLVQELRHEWLDFTRKFHEENSDIDLHMHLCSTVASADELHKGGEIDYKHRDEMWIWIPFTDLSIEHLKLFLSEFKTAPHVVNNDFEIIVLGPGAHEMMTIFRESFKEVPIREEKCKYNKETVAVLTYNPGSLNSRKAMITPFVPKVNKT